MELLLKNKEILEDKYPEMFSKKIKKDHFENLGQIEVINTENGNQTIGITRNGYTWTLTSRVDSEYAAQIYVKRYEPINLFGIYFIYGFSDGKVIREMLKKADDSVNIIVCEPCGELFKRICSVWDISDVLQDKRVSLYIPEYIGSLDAILKHYITYASSKVVEFCILPNYDVLFPEQCQKYMNDILEKIQQETIHMGTKIYFNRMVPQNTFYHMKHMIGERNHLQLQMELQGQDLEEIPAFIISAGPSLDKNIKELKRAQGKSLIISVDAALRTVYKAGIQPDIICTIDSESPDRFFEGLELKDRVWACNRLTRPWILDTFGGSVFYSGYFSKEWNMELDETLGYPFPDLISGGSVSSDAFMLALYLGFKKIVLIGQDMAFTNGISHTEGIEGAFGDNDEYINSRYRVKVEGIHGEELETDFQMWYYKQWFEKVIQVNEGKFEVINATEGGANIAGAKNRILHEVIDELCEKELNVYEIARTIPPAFSKEQKQKLINKLQEIPQQVEKLKNDLEHIVAIHQKALKALRNTEISSSAQIGHYLKAINTESKQIEENPAFFFMSFYAQNEEYELSESIYAKQDMTPIELVKKSMKLYHGYASKIAMLEEDVQNYIVQDKVPVLIERKE